MITDFISAELAAVADPDRAANMAAYMKTEMPIYGVSRPVCKRIFKAATKRFPPGDAAEYDSVVRALWALEHREEKYAAIAFARAFPAHITLDAMPLYEKLIREGAWWDLVDEVAPRLVGPLLLDHPDVMEPVMDRWLDDDSVWIRRSAIISRLGHRDRTDAARLFDACRRRAHEKVFWVRKAIGWALRSYARVDPDAVRDFCETHKAALSGLSYREATKHL